MSQSEDSKEAFGPTENWSTDALGSYLRVSNNVLTRTGSAQIRSHSNQVNGYGTKLITKGKHSWIVKFTGSHKPEIGITSNFTQFNDQIFNTKHSVSYHGTTIRGYLNNKQGETFVSSVKQIQSGDIIKIELDLDKKTVAFYNPYNSKTPLGTVSNLPNTNGWKLCVFTTTSNGQVLTILTSKSGGGINVWQLNNTIKSANEHLNNLKNNKTLVNDIKLLSLKQLLNSKNLIKQYKNNRKILDNKLKEYDNELQKIESIIDKQIKPDPKNYSEWRAKEICRYIISIDAKNLSQYSEKLEKSLAENDLDGDDIKDITKNDLIPFGISKFKHRTVIYNALQDLVNGNVNNNNNKEGSKTTEYV